MGTRNGKAGATRAAHYGSVAPQDSLKEKVKINTLMSAEDNNRASLSEPKKKKVAAKEKLNKNGYNSPAMKNPFQKGPEQPTTQGLKIHVQPLVSHVDDVADDRTPSPHGMTKKGSMASEISNMFQI